MSTGIDAPDTSNRSSKNETEAKKTDIKGEEAVGDSIVSTLPKGLSETNEPSGVNIDWKKFENKPMEKYGGMWGSLFFDPDPYIFSPPPSSLTPYDEKYWKTFKVVQNKFRCSHSLGKFLEIREELLELRDKSVIPAIAQPITEFDDHVSYSPEVIKFSTRPNLVVLLGEIQTYLPVVNRRREKREDFNLKIIERKIRVDLKIVQGEDYIHCDLIPLKEDIEVKMEEDEEKSDHIRISLSESRGEKVDRYINELKYNRECEFLLFKNYTKDVLRIMKDNSKIRRNFHKKEGISEEEKEKEPWLLEQTPIPEITLKGVYGNGTDFACRTQYMKARQLFSLLRATYSRYHYRFHLCTISIATTHFYRKEYKVGYEQLIQLLNFMKYKIPEEKRHEMNNKFISIILYRLAVFHAFYLDDLDGGMRLINESLELSPTIMTLKIRCRFHHMMKEYEKQIADLDEILKNTVNEHQKYSVLMSIVNIHYRLKNYESALQRLQQARDMNVKTNFLQYYTLGSCYYHLKKYEEARKYLEQALVTNRRKMNRTKRLTLKIFSLPGRNHYARMVRRNNTCVSYLCISLFHLGKKNEAMYFLEKEFRSVHPDEPVPFLKIRTMHSIRAPKVLIANECRKYLHVSSLRRKKRKKTSPSRDREFMGKDSFVRLNLASSLQHIAGQYPESIRLYSELIRRKYELQYCYYNRGSCYSRAGRYDLSLKDLEAVKRLLESQNAKKFGNEYLHKLYFRIGFNLVALGRYEEAFVEYKKSLTYNPQGFETHFEMTRAYYAMEDHSKSLSYFDYVIEHILGQEKDLQKYQQPEQPKLSSQYFRIIFAKSIVYKGLGHREGVLESIKLLSFLISRNYQHLSCLHNRGWIYLDLLSDLESSTLDANELIRRYPLHFGGYLLLAEVHKLKEEYLPAIKSYQKGVDLIVNNPFPSKVVHEQERMEALLDIGECYYRLLDYKSSKRVLLEVIALRPDEPKSYFQLGNILQMENDHEGAITNFEKSIQRGWNHQPFVYWDYASSLFSVGRDEEAKKKLERYVELALRSEFWKKKRDQKLNLNEINELIQVGDSLMVLERFEEALIYHKIVLENSNDVNEITHLKIGTCYSNTNQRDLAIKHLGIVLKINPESSAGLKKRAHEYLKAGKYKECYLDCCQFCKILSSPSKRNEKKKDIEEDYGILFWMALCEHALGMSKKAIQTFDGILLKRPDIIFCHYEKGNIYYEQFETKKSIECYSKLLAEKPEHLQTLNNRGLCYHRLFQQSNSTDSRKYLELAIRDFDTCLKVSENKYHRANYNKATLLREIRRREEAIHCYTLSLQVKFEENCLLDRAHTFIETRKWKEAFEDLNQCVEFSRSGPNINLAFLQRCLYDRALCQARLLDYVEAIRDYDQVIQLNKNFSGAYLARGKCNMVLKYFDLALSDFDEFLKLRPQNLNCLELRVSCFKSLKKYRMAIQECHKIISLFFNHSKNNNSTDNAIMMKCQANMFFEIGVCHQRLFELEKSVEYLTKAIRAYPSIFTTYDEAYYQRGIVYEMMGNLEEAVKDFQVSKKNKNEAVIKIKQIEKKLNHQHHHQGRQSPSLRRRKEDNEEEEEEEENEGEEVGEGKDEQEADDATSPMGMDAVATGAAVAADAEGGEGYDDDFDEHAAADAAAHDCYGS